jgi:hypothetical protein
MEKLDRLIRTLEALPSTIENLMEEALELSEPDMAQMQRDQWAKGEYADGTPIQPEYKPFTKRKKIAEGKDPGKVTLKDKGRMYGATFSNVSNKTVMFGSKDSKAPALFDKYGKEGPLLGLQPQNIKDLSLLKLKPYVLQELRNSLK